VAEGIRLQKYLSMAGRASRREAERLMAEGRVLVNGAVVTTMGTRVTPGRDVVELDGTPVELSASRWVMLHKPRGCLTTRRDPHGGATVYDILPPDADELRYVGRLDRDTSGLLLFCNEGDLIHELLHPSREVEREYRAVVAGTPSPETLRRLTDGVVLADGPARARWVDIVGKDGPDVVVGLVLTEGRKREVRRLLEAVGHPVKRLARVRFGPVELGSLAEGEARPLSDHEISLLRASVRGE
jgi:23S rRNA pseudouridine2605 synthase